MFDLHSRLFQITRDYDHWSSKAGFGGGLECHVPSTYPSIPLRFTPHSPPTHPFPKNGQTCIGRATVSQETLVISVTVCPAFFLSSTFMPYANNKGADQPAHPRSLISAFVVCCLDSIIPLLAIAEIARP